MAKKPNSNRKILRKSFSSKAALLAGLLAAFLGVVVVFATRAQSATFTTTAYSPASVGGRTTKTTTFKCGPYNDDGRRLYTRATASGECPQAGRTIAADWSRLANGTTVCVGGGVGTRVVRDRGGKVTGNRVDIWYNSTSQARQWGTRNVTITWPGACGSGGGSTPPPPTSGNCDNHPTIRQSRTGGSTCVKHLQGHLNNYGYGLAVDGAWGPITNNAVRDFQAKRDLVVDGIVGPNTWNALHTSSDPLPLGYVDGAGCDIYGWAFDRSNTSAEIPIHFYIGGQFAGDAYTSQSRPDVNNAYGISGNHGFNFRVPDQFRGGVVRTYDVYAINIPDTSKNTRIYSQSKSC